MFQQVIKSKKDKSKFTISLSKLLVSLAIICSFLGSGVSFGTLFGINIIPERIIGIICALWLILNSLLVKNYQIKYGSIAVAYIYIVIISLLFSENHLKSLSLLLDYLCVFSIFSIIAVNVVDEKTYKENCNLFLFCVLLTIVICFYEYITRHHVARNYSQAYSKEEWAYEYTIKAPTAFLYNPNNVAVVMLISIPLMLDKIRIQDRFFYKSIWFFVVVLDFTVIFMTGSRGALVGGAFIVITYFFLSNMKLRLKLFILIFCWIVISCCSDFIFRQLEYGGMIENGKINIFSDGDGGRKNIALQALQNVFVRNPLLGSGAGAIENKGLISAHNMPIEIICNYGLVGLLIFVVLIAKLVKRFFSQNNKIISMCLLLAFFISMVIPPTIMTLPVLFIPISLRTGRSVGYKKR